MTLKRIVAYLLCAAAAVTSCTDTEEIDKDLDRMELRARKAEAALNAANAEITALREIFSGKVYVDAYQQGETGWTLSFSDGTTVEVLFGDKMQPVVPVIGVDADGKWTMSTDGGTTFTPIPGAGNAYAAPSGSPVLGVDADLCWRYSVDGGTSWTQIKDADGLPMSAADGTSIAGTWSFFKDVRPDGTGTQLLFTLTDNRTATLPLMKDSPLTVNGFTQDAKIRLGETLAYGVGVTDVAGALFKVPDEWDAVLSGDEIRFTAPGSAAAGSYELMLAVTTSRGLLKDYRFRFTLEAVGVDESSCKPWNDFVSQNAENILPDFSYAGFDHGRSAPPDVWSLGYKVYNICDYGAVPNDGKDDRQAFLDCLTAAFGSPSSSAAYLTFSAGANARKIIYIPEGEYIFYTDDDKVYINADGHPDTQAIRIYGGNVVLKGAGRDKTRVLMTGMLLPQNHTTYTSPSTGMYSSSWLICMCGAGTDSAADTRFTSGARISENAAKGAFSVKVASNPQNLKAGDWVCMRAIIPDSAYIAAELEGMTPLSNWDINTSGISLREYHQVKSVSGNTITFEEPLMHAVDASKNFYIPLFTHTTGLGVEDITFVGQNVNDFVHHGSWIPDGAYKPLDYFYCTDSWLRRCGFEGVSEVCTFSYGANNAMYDLTVSGWRGHNNARVARQSFTFVGKCSDTSDGLVHSYNPAYSKGFTLSGAGSFHGNGVAYESSANVFWRDSWGKDAAFESHGRQSRCNLFDCCDGGFMSHRQGGGTDDMPNHMGDLVFWNFDSSNSWSGNFDWWSPSTAMYVVKPILVGMHGSTVKSLASTVKIDYSNGAAVDVESLYEAQLRRRLGAVPAWLNSIK